MGEHGRVLMLTNGALSVIEARLGVEWGVPALLPAQLREDVRLLVETIREQRTALTAAGSEIEKRQRIVDRADQVMAAIATEFDRATTHGSRLHDLVGWYESAKA